MIPTRNPHPLKTKIKESGLFLWQVAKALGIDDPYLSRQLNGIVPIKPEVVSGIEKILLEVEKQRTQSVVMGSR